MNTNINPNLLLNAGNLMLGGDPAFAPDMPAAALLPQALPAAVQPALSLDFAAALRVQQQVEASVAVPLDEAVSAQAQGAVVPATAQAPLPAPEAKCEDGEAASAPDGTLAALLLTLPAQQAPLPVVPAPTPMPLPDEVAVLPPAVQAPAPVAEAVVDAAPGLRQAAFKAIVAAPVAEKTQPQAAALAPAAAPVFAAVLSTVEPASPAAPVLSLPSIQLGSERTPAAADAPSPLLQALGDRLQLQIAARSERAVIRLEPPQMGRVDIAIARQDGAALEVRLSASHGEVQRQLQQGSEALRLDLAQRHGGEVSVQVSAAPRESAEGRGHQPQQQQRQPSQQHPQQPERQQPGRALNTADESSATPFELA